MALPFAEFKLDLPELVMGWLWMNLLNFTYMIHNIPAKDM